jgi:hypothetical protein
MLVVFVIVVETTQHSPACLLVELRIDCPVLDVGSLTPRAECLHRLYHFYDAGTRRRPWCQRGMNPQMPDTDKMKLVAVPPVSTYERG